MHPFSYNGVATPGRPGGIRRSPLDTTAAGGTKGAHSRGQASRCLRAGRGEHRSVLRTPEDADPRGENSPPPGFRPRRRGHFGDTPWLRPGGPRRDSQVPTRASCGWARDAGSPGGERGPDSRNSLQDGGGCRRAWEPARGSAGLGTSGYRMSKAGQLIVRANRRFLWETRVVSPSRLQSSLGAGTTPRSARASVTVYPGPGHRGQDRTQS
ncbi:hypothetical protein H8957_001007, partial [Semnopithecus entellus]